MQASLQGQRRVRLDEWVFWAMETCLRMQRHLLNAPMYLQKWSYPKHGSGCCQCMFRRPLRASSAFHASAFRKREKWDKPMANKITYF
jgi:hypothetical protein